MLKYLRIAVTALCLASCVLLVALWVRSYWTKDSVSTGTQRDYLEVISHKGWLRVQVFHSPRGSFHWPYRTLFKVRHLLPALVAAAMATIPWIRWKHRFSLRTLLIATTLVAVGMGVVIYLAR